MVEHCSRSLGFTPSRSRLLTKVAALGTLVLLALLGGRSAQALPPDCTNSTTCTSATAGTNPSYAGPQATYDPNSNLKPVQEENKDTDPLTYDGAFVIDEVDVTLPSRSAQPELQYRFSRHYNSRVSTNFSALGHGWIHNYEEYIAVVPAKAEEFGWRLPGHCERYYWDDYPWGPDEQLPAECEYQLPPTPLPRVSDLNGDVMVVQGARALRFRRTGGPSGAPDADGVIRFESYPDTGQVLEYRGRQGGVVDTETYRLVNLQTGVTRVYKMVVGSIGSAQDTFNSSGALVALGSKWQTRPVEFEVRAGYFLSEITDGSNNRMTFTWGVIPLANELLESVPEGGHGATPILTRLREVVDTTGRRIYYHYRDPTPNADDGSAFPELACVSLSSSSTTCDPANANTAPALIAFNYGGAPDFSGQRRTSVRGFDATVVRPMTAGTLLAVNDAQGRAVHRYDYDLRRPTVPLARRGSGTGTIGTIGYQPNYALPNKERDRTCRQICGDSPNNNPPSEAVFPYSADVAWNGTPANVCGVGRAGVGYEADVGLENFPGGVATRRGCEAFSPHLGALGTAGENAVAACIEYMTQVRRELPPVGEDYSYFCGVSGDNALYDYGGGLQSRLLTYNQCQAEATISVTANGYCGDASGGTTTALGDYTVYDHPQHFVYNDPVVGSTEYDGYNPDEGTLHDDGFASDSAAAVNQCLVQCDDRYEPGDSEYQGLLYGQYVYGRAEARLYNITKVYNALGNVEVENTYGSTFAAPNTALDRIDRFDFDRVTHQVVNQGTGLESATLDVQYFDLERLGSSTGSNQVLAQSAFVDDDLYECDDTDAEGVCINWVNNGPGTQRPVMATRTHSVHDEYTVAYLNARGELLRVDTFDGATSGTPIETVKSSYDARGRVVNQLSASGERTLRQYRPGNGGALWSETRLASTAAGLTAPSTGSTMRTVYGIDTNGQLQDTRTYDAAGVLVAWTHLTRDAQQRVTSSEVRYSTASTAPVYGTSYSYENTTTTTTTGGCQGNPLCNEETAPPEVTTTTVVGNGTPVAEATWIRQNGTSTSRNVLSITRRSTYEALMGAYKDVNVYDAQSRAVADGSDATAVVSGDQLLSTSSMTFDSAKALVTRTTVPGRTETTMSYDASRRPVATTTTVDAAPLSGQQTRTTSTRYCETDPSTGNPTSVCGALPLAMEESWTDPLTNATQVRVTTFKYDALNQVVATTVGGRGALPFLSAASSATTCRHLSWDGRELDMVNAEGEWTTYEYDKAGRRLAVQQGYKNPLPSPLPAWAVPCQVKLQANVIAGKTQSEELERNEYLPGGLVSARIVGGLRTTFAYDGFGRVIGERDPAGRETRRGYDAQGRVLWEASYRANLSPVPNNTKPATTAVGLLSLTEMSYDPQGRVTEAKSWDLDKQQALTTTTSYNDAQRQTITTAPNGVRTTTDTDAAGRATNTLLSDANYDYSETSTTYDWAANTVHSTGYDNRGATDTTMRLDGNGQVREALDGTTVLNTQTNDVFGRTVKRRTRGLGEDQFTYDTLGRMTSQTVAEIVTTSSRDAACPATGPCTSFAFGYTLATQQATPRSYTVNKTNCYWVDGEQYCYVSAATTNSLNSQCNTAKQQEIDAAKAVILSPYTQYQAQVSATSSLVMTSEENPFETTATYECRITVTYPQPNTGTEEVHPLVRTDFGYDQLGRRTRVSQWGSINASGVPQDESRTDYAYDALGRVIQVTAPTDPNATPRTQTTRYLTRSVTVAGAPKVQATSSISTLTTFGGTTGTFSYDPTTGRLTSEVFHPLAGATVLQADAQRDWTYDDCSTYTGTGACGYGRLIRGQITHTRTNGTTGSVPLPVTTDNRYDRRGRLLESWNNVGNVHVTHGYDLLGAYATTQLTGTSNVLTHRFDVLARLNTIDLKIDAGAAETLASYDYGNGGGASGLVGPALKTTYGDGSWDDWTYDALRRPTRLLVGRNITGGTETLAIRREAYGEHGIALMREHTFRIGAGLQTTADAFQVDAAGRLIAERTGITGATVPTTEIAASAVASTVTPWLPSTATAGLGPNWRQYQLDGRSNWKTRVSQDAQDRTWQTSVTANALNAYTGFTLQDLATTTSTAFSLSRTAEDDTTVAPSYRPGAPAGEGVEFTYDLFDHPLTLTNRTSTTAATTTNVTYDAFGHRVLEEEPARNVRSYLLWSGDEIVGQGYVGSAGGPPPAASAYQVRVAGAQLDSTIVELPSGGGSVSNRTYYHQWTDGSTLALTGTAGLKDGVRYSAWGEIAQSTTGLTANYHFGLRFLWKGAFYDSWTKTYSMRAREFSPQWGRFLSTDPIGQEGGLNVYAFGMGRSDLRDPSGLKESPQTSGCDPNTSCEPIQVTTVSPEGTDSRTQKNSSAGDFKRDKQELDALDKASPEGGKTLVKSGDKPIGVAPSSSFGPNSARLLAAIKAIGKYSYVTTDAVGKTKDGFSAAGVSKSLQTQPNGAFPFKVVPKDGGDATIRLGGRYDLNDVRFPYDNGNGIIVVQQDDLSFTFETDASHFDGANATIKFRTYEENGTVFLEHTADAPNAGLLNATVAPIGAINFVWPGQAANLRARGGDFGGNMGYAPPPDRGGIPRIDGPGGYFSPATVVP